jgi:PAS domain-containing protein
MTDPNRQTPSGEFERKIIREITDLARRADQLQTLLFAALEHVPVPCTVVDAAGSIVRLNRAARVHTGQEFDLGAGVVDWPDIHYRNDGTRYPPEDLPLARSLRGGEIVRAEPVTVEWSPTHTTHLLVSSRPVRDVDGEIIGAIATWPATNIQGT